MWDIEVTDQFVQWWDTLSVEDQEPIEAAVELLEQLGRASAGRSSTP